jgi:hypothetical protein
LLNIFAPFLMLCWSVLQSSILLAIFSPLHSIKMVLNLAAIRSRSIWCLFLCLYDTHYWLVSTVYACNIPFFTSIANTRQQTIYILSAYYFFRS